MDRPAFSQLRSTLKAASIRSLPSCKGMTDVLASSRYSNTYFKNYSVVHCQAWMKWYLVNFHIEYGEYITIHFPIVAQIKRNWGTGKYEQVQFIWINCHKIPFTIMKSPLKFAALSTLNPCLSVGSSNQVLSGSTSLIPVAAQTSLKASFSKFLWAYGQLARIIS